MGRILDIKNYKEPRRFQLRFYDTKKIFNNNTFNNKAAARQVLKSLIFIKSELELWDSKNKKIIWSYKNDKN